MQKLKQMEDFPKNKPKLTWICKEKSKLIVINNFGYKEQYIVYL